MMPDQQQFIAVEEHGDLDMHHSIENFQPVYQQPSDVHFVSDVQHEPIVDRGFSSH